MTELSIETRPAMPQPAMSWEGLAERTLAGHGLTREEGLAILRAPDSELPALLAAAFRVRFAHFGRKVHLY